MSSSSSSSSSAAMSLPGDPPGGRRALAVWGIGVSVYFVAVIFRTSLGVAGLDAAERFHVNANLFPEVGQAAHRCFDISRFVARGNDDRNGLRAVRFLRRPRDLKYGQGKLGEKRREKAINDFFQPEAGKRQEQPALLLDHVPAGQREHIAHVRCT